MRTYLIIAGVTAVPFFARHTAGGAVGWFLYVAGLALLARYAPKRRVAAILVLLLAGADVALFPGTRLVAHPSTAPEAMAVPIRRLLHGLEPYGQVLHDGAPISPGPGWLLLNSVLPAQLLVPFWLGLAAWTLRRAGAAPGAFVALAMAPLAFLQMSVVGHDIFAISLAFTAVTAIAYAVAGHPRRLAAVAVLAGTIATARLPLCVVLPVIGLGLAWQRGRPAGRRFTIVSVAVAALWHGAAALWCVAAGDPYPPLHLFARAHAGAGPWFTLLGAGGAVATAAWLCRPRPRPLEATLFAAWLLQTAMFLPVGVGELVRAQHLAWADWEGKNYVAYPMPLLAAAIVLRAASVVGPARKGGGLRPLDPHRRAAGVTSAARHKISCAAQRW